MRVEQISVLLRNELGVLRKILEFIGKANINILGLMINETASFGELRLVVSDTKKTQELLKKMELSHNVVKIIVVGLENKPGKLLEIAHLLSENDINIDYIYTLFSNKNSAFIAIKTWDMPATEQLLTDNNIKIASLADIMQ